MPKKGDKPPQKSLLPDPLPQIEEAPKPIKFKPEPPPYVKPDPCEWYEPEDNLKNIVSKPNSYPGLLEIPRTMAILGSETASYANLKDLIKAGLQCADRAILMTPWGNYAIFRSKQQKKLKKPPGDPLYFLHDGCTCNVNAFRYYDLKVGTAGFLTFNSLNLVISYILTSRYRRERLREVCKPLLDDICVERQSTGEEEQPEEVIEQPKNSKKPTQKP